MHQQPQQQQQTVYTYHVPQGGNMTTPITMQYHLLQQPGGGHPAAYQPQPHQHRAPAPNNVMQAGAPPFTPGGQHPFYPTQPPHSAPPQQQLIYAQQQQGLHHAQMQAMQRHAQAQQMGFPQMMGQIPGQPGQHPYGTHPLHMSQGPPQQQSHPGMGPPQQQQQVQAQAPHFQPRGQSQGPPNQQQGGPGGPPGSQQGPPQGQQGQQQPPRGGPGAADAQQGAPPPASTPPQGPPSLGHNGPPAPQQQQQQQPQPPQGPPSHSGGPPSGTSTLTRERKRIAIIDPTTRQEVSVDGTSADKKVTIPPPLSSPASESGSNGPKEGGEKA